MDHQSNKPDTRLLFRWLAFVTCPFFFFAAAATAFPKIIGGNGQPSFLLAALLFWGGFLFASIAATGKLRQ
jgi:ABC-type transport system involved in cytochrome c biogenesis permease component